MEDQQVALRVSGVHKTFKLPHQKHSSLKSMFINIFRARRTYEEQHVLKDISFEVKKGEFFGVIGRNGSGKSTLLKLMAGIYMPDKGSIQINGRLVPFIELGVGFNPELTGRENVFLNGALLGFNRKEMLAMYDEIVEFAELERFMDQSLKNYSSGMQVRLAFSIAIRAKSDILLIDEVLAVGDANFQKKCFEIFKKMKNEKKTVIFVSHSMGDVKEYCDRAVVIENGKIVEQGSTEKAISKYNEINRVLADKELQRLNARARQAHNKKNGRAALIKRVWAADTKNNKTTLFKPYDTIVINCEVTALQDLENPTIVIKCRNPGGPTLFSVNSKAKKLKTTLKTNETLNLVWETPNIFNDGTYIVDVSVYDKEITILHDQITKAYTFDIEGWDNPYTLIHHKDKARITTNSS